MHEPDDTYATSQPSSKARSSVRGVACPPQWLPVLLTAASPSLTPPPSPPPSSPPPPLFAAVAHKPPPPPPVNGGCLNVEGSITRPSVTNLNGQYKPQFTATGSLYFTRADDSMVIRISLGYPGWDFCVASKGVVVEPCHGSYYRKGYVKDDQGKPAAATKITIWVDGGGGVLGDSSISYPSSGCSMPPSQPPVLSPPPPPPLSCSGGWIQPAGPNCAGVDEPEQKKFCNTEIYNNETGYCQCTDQNVTFSCDTTGIGDPRPPFTCTQVCNTASPGLQPCTGTRRDCSRYVCNPNGKYEAYYDIPGRPDQAPKGGLVTKVEVIFDNDRYNNGLAPPEYSGDNRYNKDFVTYSLISTGCTYGDGKFNESVKYNTTTNKPINPPTCTPKRDGEFNSNGEPIKKQPVVYGRFDDAPYEFNDVRYGDGNGALFSPVEETPLTVSKIFEFRWCPDQNTFQVMVFKTGPYQFVHVKPEDIVAGKQAEIDQLQADNIQLQANNAQCAADSTGTLILHFP